LALEIVYMSGQPPVRRSTSIGHTIESTATAQLRTAATKPASGTLIRRNVESNPSQRQNAKAISVRS